MIKVERFGKNTAMTFNAEVKAIKSVGKVSEITFSSAIGNFAMLGLDVPSGLCESSKVTLGFKSSDVIICTGGIEGLNILTNNKIPAIVEKIEYGTIIATLSLKAGDFKFEAVIAAELASNLKAQDNIVALVSETSLFISEIL